MKERRSPRGDPDPGHYVFSARRDTREYVDLVLAENDTLRAQAAGLETRVHDLEERVYRLQLDVDRRREVVLQTLQEALSVLDFLATLAAVASHGTRLHPRRARPAAEPAGTVIP